MSVTSFTVRVPATTANLGSGFDCIGAALTLYNHFTFTAVQADSHCIITVQGTEAGKVSTNKRNLLYRAFTKFYQYVGQPVPGVEIEIQLGVPLARGLGSSATAIVGGLVGANELAASPLSTEELMQLAIALEGHPDNVVPALLGNCQLAVGQGDSWDVCDVPWHSDIVPVVAIPDFQLSTAMARSVLPDQISRADAIFNVSHMGLLLRGLATGRREWLQRALNDRLHQPYRQELICGYREVQEAATAAGAYGVVISGAGPTLLALTNAEKAQAVTGAMAEAWQTQGVEAQVRSLALDPQGAIADSYSAEPLHRL
ncbi:MAG: homoserine kinase [Cyanophyceae cyanobacterium]